MFLAILIVHVLVSIFLVLIVLVQTGRGAELGAAFGGTGQATFGRTQATFLTKLTTALAVIFMATSLSLAFIASDQPSRSIITTPAPPAQEAAGEPPPAAEAKGESQQAEQAAPETPLEQTKAPPKPNPEPPKTQ
jgi:preprotein translocase subunit SecG